MGYLIRMAPEVEEWLAAIRDRDPAAADLIDEAEAVVDDASAGAEGPSPAVGDAVDAESRGPAPPPLWLSELRPGAPDSAGARILFTVRPPGTAVLLAAGVESDWLRAWYTEAVANCRIRYRREHY
jgi:hypothetical protein